MERIRKALVAGVLAWLGAIVTAAVEGGTPTDAQGWVALIVGALGVGVLAGLATYKVRNTGPGIGVNGSEYANPTDPRLRAASVRDDDPPRYRPGRSGGRPTP